MIGTLEISGAIWEQDLISPHIWTTGVSAVQGIDFISDYGDRAASLLIEQFQKKVFIEGTVRALAELAQDAENNMRDVYSDRLLANASGAQLDGIGEIVGVSRLGSTDEEYRELIDFKIFLNQSNGEPETLIRALKTLTGSANVTYEESYPAGVVLTFDGTSIPDDLVTKIEQIAPAGVSLTIIQNPEDPFIMGSITVIPPDSEGLGFSDVTQLTGGQFSQIVT